MPSVGVPLPPPFKGQNDQLPKFSVENPYCIRMQNFEPTAGVAKLRQGNERWGSVSSYLPWHLAPYNQSLFAVAWSGDTRFYDITGGSFTLAHTVAAQSLVPIKSLFFRNYLFFFGNNGFAPGFSGPQQYTGSAWGAAAYTWPSSFQPYGGCVYKNRAYFIDLISPRYSYSEIDAISGATTEVNLRTVISSSALLYGVGSISTSENVTQDNIFLTIFSNGEILAYTGSFPNSSNWSLAARSQVSPPISYNSSISAKGDVFLLCESEIVSLRNVISKGYSVEQSEGIGAAIKNRYRQIIRAIKDYSLVSQYTIVGAYDSTNDRLIISFPYYVDPDTGSISDALHFLIYDFTLGAWYEIYQPLITNGTIASVAHFNQNSYALAYDGANTVALKIGSKTDYLDDVADTTTNTQGIQYKLESAPHPLNRFGVVKTDGLEAIMKSDIYSTANFRLIGDLGASTTAAQKTSGNGTNVTKVFANLGIESNLVQYEISGTSTTSTVGLELYGTNLWVSPSQGVAR